MSGLYGGRGKGLAERDDTPWSRRSDHLMATVISLKFAMKPETANV